METPDPSFLKHELSYKNISNPERQHFRDVFSVKCVEDTNGSKQLGTGDGGVTVH